VKLDLEDALASLEDARHEDVDEQVANALFRVGVACLERRRWDQAGEALDEARYLCTKLENHPGRARVALAEAQVAEARGDAGRAQKLAREALEVFTTAGDTASRLKALEVLSQALAAAGRLEEAAAVLEEALGLVREGGDQVAELLFTQYVAPLYRRLGRSGEALDAYRSVGRLAHAKGDHMRVALAAVGVGTLEAELGRPEPAREAFGQARELFKDLGQLGRAGQVEAEMARLGLGPGPAQEEG
jgi:tetratricopeptide (TPR) repeat protein